jgi:hypothetical protein
VPDQARRASQLRNRRLSLSSEWKKGVDIDSSHIKYLKNISLIAFFRTCTRIHHLSSAKLNEAAILYRLAMEEISFAVSRPSRESIGTAKDYAASTGSAGETGLVKCSNSDTVIKFGSKNWLFPKRIHHHLHSHLQMCARARSSTKFHRLSFFYKNSREPISNGYDIPG